MVAPPRLIAPLFVSLLSAAVAFAAPPSWARPAAGTLVGDELTATLDVLAAGGVPAGDRLVFARVTDAYADETQAIAELQLLVPQVRGDAVRFQPAGAAVTLRGWLPRGRVWRVPVRWEGPGAVVLAPPPAGRPELLDPALLPPSLKVPGGGFADAPRAEDEAARTARALEPIWQLFYEEQLVPMAALELWSRARRQDAGLALAPGELELVQGRRGPGVEPAVVRVAADEVEHPMKCKEILGGTGVVLVTAFDVNERGRASSARILELADPQDGTPDDEEVAFAESTGKALVWELLGGFRFVPARGPDGNPVATRHVLSLRAWEFSSTGLLAQPSCHQAAAYR